jgi:hypothetical protein
MDVTSPTATNTIKTKQIKNRLIIKPKPGLARLANSIFIDRIIANGSLESIKIKFPPGTKQGGASCVRNIDVGGYLKSLSINGGDLGAGDGQDGKVSINGNVKSINIKGRKYKNTQTNKMKVIEWYGGNIWADIDIAGSVDKIIAKGGNIHLDRHGGILGKISVDGDIKLLAADGVKVKEFITNEAGTGKLTTNKFYGGGINTDIYASNHEIRQIRARGGAIVGGGIYCRQVRTMKVLGQKSKSHAPVSIQAQGIFNTLVETYHTVLDSHIKKILVKNGSVRDSIFSAYKDIKSFKITGETNASVGIISNTTIRAGITGGIPENERPLISPLNYSTSTAVRSTLILPFIATSQDTNELLTARIHYRGAALGAMLLDDQDNQFSGTNRLKGGYSLTGKFMWVASDVHKGIHSNIVIRVRDNGIPNYYTNLNLTIIVTDQGDEAPVLTLTPPDITRTFSKADPNKRFWIASAYDVDLGDEITFSVENAFPGLIVSNVSSRVRQYYFYPNNPNITEDVYSNITFKITDKGGQTDSKSVTSIFVDSNSVHAVFTSLPANNFVWPISKPLSFYVIATNVWAKDFIFITNNISSSEINYPGTNFVNVTAASNLFQWTPDFSDSGEKKLIFKVEDTDQNANIGSVEVKINVSNTAPEVSVSLPDATFNWLTSKKLDFHVIAESTWTNNLMFLEPNNPPITNPWTYNFTNAIYVMIASNQFQWTPINANIATHDLSFRVVSTNYQILTNSIDVSINVVNPDPHIFSSLTTDEIKFEVGEYGSFYIIVTNQWANDFTFLPTNIFDSVYNSKDIKGAIAASNLFEWTPKDSDKGDYTLQFQVKDIDQVSNAFVNIKITVVRPEFDIFTSLGSTNFSWPTSKSLEFYIIATNSWTNSYEFYRPTVDFPASAKYADANFPNVMAASNKFEWTPDISENGTTHHLAFTVFNSDLNLTMTSTVTIIVENFDPVISTSLNNNDFKWLVEDPLSFNVIATDNEPNNFEFLPLSDRPDGATYASSSENGVLSSSNPFNWTPNASQVGTNILVFRVNSSGGIQGSVTVTCRVVNAVSTSLSTNSICRRVGDLLTFNVIAEDSVNKSFTFLQPANLTDDQYGLRIVHNTNYAVNTFTWTPSETGKYEWTFEVVVSGTPLETNSVVVTGVVITNGGVCPISLNVKEKNESSLSRLSVQMLPDEIVKSATATINGKILPYTVNDVNSVIQNENDWTEWLEPDENFVLEQENINQVSCAGDSTKGKNFPNSVRHNSKSQNNQLSAKNVDCQQHYVLNAICKESQSGNSKRNKKVLSNKQLRASGSSSDGGIRKISCVGDVIYNKFIGGVKENEQENWATATYLGSIKQLKFLGTVVSNLVITKKPIKIRKPTKEDFEKDNDVWENGTPK